MTHPYKNPALSVETRVEDLLSRMTREEKTGQLNQISGARDKVDEVRDLVRKGRVGSRILASSAFAGSDEQRTASVAEGNTAQKIAMEETRLGIPLINGRDVIHGYRTVFPIPLAQAASFDPELVKEALSYAAAEARSEGIHWTFAPMMDVARDPRWGRVIEGYGEDPHLSSVMAVATVKGLQGDDLCGPGRIAACAKHYIAYGLAEGGREYNTVDVSENTIRNVYLPPFRACVKAGVATVMTSFNEIGGVPVSGSVPLVRKLLKEELGFDGFVVSDWDSVKQMISHGFAAHERDAARAGLAAGVDMEMTIGCYEKHLCDLIDSGEIDTGLLDDAVRRILRIKFRLGLFDNPYTDPALPQKVFLAPAHRASARTLASAGIVLLKNANGILPLKQTAGRIAVAGPMAQVKRELLGSWVLDGREEDTVSILEGIRSAAPDLHLSVPSQTMSDQILGATRWSDAVVVCIGESHNRTGEGASISDITLPAGQKELIEQLHKTGKPVIAVICAGRPLDLTGIMDKCDAVLYCWHGGTEAGNAIADVLLGRVNPSGKLPMSLPRCTGQIPVYYNHKPTGQMEWIGMDYYGGKRSRYTDIPSSPLFPFGYGLSYTSFAYSALALSASEIPANGYVDVSATITNTGERAGHEIVQCYIRDVVASTTRPVRELKGFRKIHLDKGESSVVTFRLGVEELSFWNGENRFVVEPGEFRVWVGGDCRGELEGGFRVV